MTKRIIAIDDEAMILEGFKEILQAPEPAKALSDLEALTAELSGDKDEKPGQVQADSVYYDLETALQGEEGYLKIKEAFEQDNPFQVAFIDVRMPPGWDGIETAKKIRQLDPYIEIVIVTAYSDRKQSEIAKIIGAPEKLLYLRKPFDTEEIRQIALSLTRKWGLEYQHRKHMDYLETMLNSIRRLKTLGGPSVKDVLAAIMDELLIIVSADKGIVYNMNRVEPLVEIFSDNLTSQEISEITDKIPARIDAINEITAVDDKMLFPLENEAGTYLILVCSRALDIDEEKLNLLKLFVETASEVLFSVNQQELFLKNEKIATIGQVAAGIIHEINNPVSSLVALIKTDGLMKKKLDCLNIASEEDQKLVQEISRYLEIASMATNHITSIVTSMKGMTGANRTIFSVQDITTAIEDALILSHNTLMKTGIVVHREWKDPLLANCDLNGLKQVFLNLILNAAQAMEKKGELWISGMVEGDLIKLSFMDNGPGVPEEEIERIFKVFYTTKNSGTGLGLSIVKAIVTNHGGTVRLESESGKGAVFQIELPAA